VLALMTTLSGRVAAEAAGQDPNLNVSGLSCSCQLAAATVGLLSGLMALRWRSVSRLQNVLPLHSAARIQQCAICDSS
jgi:hypothetical protein